MSLEIYRSLERAADPKARAYLESHFDVLFAQAIDEFSLFGSAAIALAALALAAAFASWLRLRRDLPLRWLWLLPVVVLGAYAGLKATVVFELIQRAPELPQMWSLYFKPLTPFKMVRTPVTGLLVATASLWGYALWARRRARRAGVR